MKSQYAKTKKKSARPKSAKTGFINLTDLMRIQREIIPSINEEKNRQLYDQKLKEISQAHILKFKGEGLRVDKSSALPLYEQVKNSFIITAVEIYQSSINVAVICLYISCAISRRFHFI